MKELLKLKQISDETASGFFRILPAKDGWFILIPARSIKFFDADFLSLCDEVAEYIEEMRVKVRSKNGKPYKLPRQREYRRTSPKTGRVYRIQHYKIKGVPEPA